jgi:putative transposase
VTYRLYPSQSQVNKLTEQAHLHRKLYNAALEQRIDAYKRCGVSLSFKDQCRELTKLRAECPEYAALNAQSQQVTLKRLDLAFSHFFRRVKAGEKSPGFPRFKSADRFKGWGYKTHGDGWFFKTGADFVNGTLRISGVGSVQARGRARFVDEGRTNRDPGTPKTIEIIRKGEKWYASITFGTPRPFRERGEEAIGVDWGTATFLTLVSEQGGMREVANPRHLKKCESALKRAQQLLSRKKRGSKNRAKAKKVLLTRHEHLANKRDDFLHQTSTAIVKSARLIATEGLNVASMTSSGGSWKAGLNRSILDTSPGTFFGLLEYKAEDAGIPYIEVPTRKIKPTQTCSCCGDVVKKPLFQRMHNCQLCGLVLGRDENAAKVMLNYALTGFVTGREPALGVESEVARSLKHETPSISEHAFQGA